MKANTIVIVDDDTDDREILRDAFLMSHNETQFLLFENGDQLLNYLQSLSDTSSLSMVMLDLNMPGKDGRETLRQIKSSKQLHSLPVVVFTTSSSPRDKLLVYEAGANCFVTKPDTFNKLVELTNSLTKLWVLEF